MIGIENTLLENEALPALIRIAPLYTYRMLRQKIGDIELVVDAVVAIGRRRAPGLFEHPGNCLQWGAADRHSDASGVSMTKARRCGRSGMSSPFFAIDP